MPRRRRPARAKRDRQHDPTMALSLETVRANEEARFDRIARMRRNPRFRRWLADLKRKEAAAYEGSHQLVDDHQLLDDELG